MDVFRRERKLEFIVREFRVSTLLSLTIISFSMFILLTMTFIFNQHRDVFCWLQACIYDWMYMMICTLICLKVLSCTRAGIIMEIHDIFSTATWLRLFTRPRGYVDWHGRHFLLAISVYCTWSIWIIFHFDNVTLCLTWHFLSCRIIFSCLE